MGKNIAPCATLFCFPISLLFSCFIFLNVSLYQELEDKLEALRGEVGNVLEASKLLMIELEPQAAPVIQSETTLLSHDLVHLSKALVNTREQLQVTDLITVPK